MMYLILTQNLICYIFKYINAAVAQLVERRTENPYVDSSILSRGKDLKENLLGLFFSHFFYILITTLLEKYFTCYTKYYVIYCFYELDYYFIAKF